MNIKYTEYIAEYIAENLAKSISYSEYIFENNIGYSEYPSEQIENLDNLINKPDTIITKPEFTVISSITEKESNLDDYMYQLYK